MSDRSEFKATPLPDCRIDVRGRAYMPDAKGNLTPVETIPAAALLEDDTVRKVVGYGLALSEQIGRFRAHAFEDIGDLEALLQQEYGVTKGGPRGNKTLMTWDGLYKVQVQVADHIDFGPQLQIAKQLVDDCLNEWSAESRPELRAIVTRAFNTDKAGQINRSEVFMLLRLEIGDARWIEAMRAIRDAMRVVGSKVYVRLYRRPAPDAGWEPISLDIARA